MTLLPRRGNTNAIYGNSMGAKTTGAYNPSKPGLQLARIMAAMPIVQFKPFSSLAQPGFWHELTNLKIGVLCLSDDILLITGSYSVRRSVKDPETGQGDVI